MQHGLCISLLMLTDLRGSCDLGEVLAYCLDDPAAPNPQSDGYTEAAIQQNVERRLRPLLHRTLLIDQPQCYQWSNSIAVITKHMQTSEVAQHWRSLLSVSFSSALNYKIFVACTTAPKRLTNSPSLSHHYDTACHPCKKKYNFLCQCTNNHAMKTQVGCGSNTPCIPQASAICGVE